MCSIHNPVGGSLPAGISVSVLVPAGYSGVLATLVRTRTSGSFVSCMLQYSALIRSSPLLEAAAAAATAAAVADTGNMPEVCL